MFIQVNNQNVQTVQFSGGEWSVCIEGIALSSTTRIEAYLSTAEQLLQLLFTVNAVRQKRPKTHIELTLPYFPYARQDQVYHSGEALSLKVIAQLINNLHCQKVIVHDPHSDALERYVDQLVVIEQHELISQTELPKFIRAQQLTLVAPDAGAQHKIAALASKLGAPALYGSKSRDPITNVISDLTLPCTGEASRFILIDDMCDSGSTAIACAQQLYTAGAECVYLYVTHGLFSQGLEPLKPYFTGVYCYHTFLTDITSHAPFLTQLKPDAP